jgi:hypothetical protein
MWKRHLFYLVLLLTQQFLHLNGQGCIPGYIYRADLQICYKHVVATGTADYARSQCLPNGDLISVTSAAIHNFIATNFTASNNVWIGLFYNGTHWTW